MFGILIQKLRPTPAGAHTDPDSADHHPLGFPGNHPLLGNHQGMCLPTVRVGYGAAKRA
jgi:hypothetical protein